MAESNPQLTAALAEFEKRLETPVVPGELPSWIEEVAATLNTVEKHLRPQVEAIHPKQLSEILRQDQGLATQVEHLVQQDREMLNHLTEVRRLAEELRKKADRIEPDEQRADDARAALVEKGLQLVIAARTQEAAIATWYVEAFERDRGVVD